MELQIVEKLTKTTYSSIFVIKIGFIKVCPKIGLESSEKFLYTSSHVLV